MTDRTRATEMLLEEFAQAELGDVRLEERLIDMVEHRLAHPEASWTAAMRQGSAVEGWYRFLNNDRIDTQDIIAPHIAGTQARIGGFSEVLVVHDTSEIKLPGGDFISRLVSMKTDVTLKRATTFRFRSQPICAHKANKKSALGSEYALQNLSPERLLSSYNFRCFCFQDVALDAPGAD